MNFSHKELCLSKQKNDNLDISSSYSASGRVICRHRELPQGVCEGRLSAPLHGAVATLAPETDVVTDVRLQNVDIVTRDLKINYFKLDI